MRVWEGKFGRGGKADITCHSIDREPLAVNSNR